MAAVIGLASGLVLLRTQGLTLLMLTLCTMALLEEAANLGHEYTGSFDGLPSLPIPPLFGVFEFNPLYPKTQYLYALLVLFLCFVFVRTLVYSPFGQSLTGIRENILRMHAVGSPVRRRLVLCYTISAAIAGIAGGLWAQTNAYVNLGALGLDRAATVLIILILGGYGRLYGAFVGAVAYMVLSHFLSKFYPTAWQLGLGLLLVVIALFARNGILGIGERLLHRFGGKRSRTMSAPPARDPQSLPQLRCARRRARHQLPAGSRCPPRPDRTQRRRQDHVRQPAHRGAAPDRRPGAAEGTRHHRRPPRPSGSSSGSRAPSRSTGCSAGSRCWRTSISRSPSGSAPRRP